MKIRIILALTFILSIGLNQLNAQNCQASFSWRANHCDSTIEFINYSHGDSLNQTPVQYHWTFYDSLGVDTSVLENPSYKFTQPGNYLVCLIISDSNCIDSACATIYYDYGYCDTCKGLGATLYNTPDTTHHGLVNFTSFWTGGTGPFSASLNFGDGHSTGVSHSNQQDTHTYNLNQGLIWGPCLTVYDSTTGCSVTSCDTVDIDTCSLNLDIAYSRSGDTATFTITATGGTGNYTVDWSFNGAAYNNAGLTQSHEFTNTGYKWITATVKSGGCSGTITYGLNFLHSSGASICGSVLDSNNHPMDSATVYLISHDSVAGTLTLVDSIVLTMFDSGYYCFHNIVAGTYLLKAAVTPGTSLFSSYLPTYFGGVINWSAAYDVHVHNGNVPNRNIRMKPGVNLGGPGFIGGLISAGANKTNNLDELDIAVILTDVNDKPLAYTKLDANHEFKFNNLPYGTYKVFVEIPGRTSAEYIIVLDENNEEMNNVNFEVNSTYITTSVDHIPFTLKNNVYPNPANDVLNIDMSVTGNHNLRAY